MRYWERLEAAIGLRNKALSFMDVNAIPPTPANYELGFHYALGEDADLKLAMDEAISIGAIATSEHARELHDRFCRTADEAGIGLAASTLQQELRKLSSTLDTAGKGSQAYARTIDHVADQLARADASPQVRALLDAVGTATKLMSASARSLEARIDASTKEVESLRSKLDIVHKESRRDALTGLSNRRSFDEMLLAAVVDAQAESTPLCVLMCDIDHFKTFNDTWGHATGDQVLRLVAQCISTNVKGRESAARFGGEELAVILPVTALADAVSVAEQIRHTVESRKIVKKSTGESFGSITMSIGVSEYRTGESPAVFLARADACVYAAKHAGRNRVCSKPPETSEGSMIAITTADDVEATESMLELPARN